MPKSVHVSTEHQGKHSYLIFVKESGGHWEWEVDRIPDIEREVVHLTPVAEGKARSRDEAVAAAQAARRKAMEENLACPVISARSPQAESLTAHTRIRAQPARADRRGRRAG
jgi:hypothetical protein